MVVERFIFQKQKFLLDDGPRPVFQVWDFPLVLGLNWIRGSDSLWFKPT